MRVPRLLWDHREATFPEWHKHFRQKLIRFCQGMDLRQTHLFHQTILQGPEQILDSALGLHRQLHRQVTLRRECCG
jgi:hypothetical protein